MEHAFKVMVVEDDPSIRHVYTSFLRWKGFQVVEAPDGPGALELFAVQPCLLLITGQHMPQMSGLELVKELRKKQPDLYVMMITATPMPLLEREALANGVDEFFAKPFYFFDIETSIRKFFATREEQGRLLEPDATLSMSGKDASQSSSLRPSVLHWLK